MEPFVLIGVVAVVVLAVTVHESAHAWVADRLGDPTARALGRVTLNPLPHVDLFMTILLPAILFLVHSPVIFGGAKPVPVDMRNFRHPWRDNAIVAAAGPVSNFLQALFWAGLLSVLLRTGLWTEESMGVKVLGWGIVVNVLLALFNLLPLPPLDGSRIVMWMLGPEARRGYLRLEAFGLLILLGLFFFVPGFQLFLMTTLYHVTDFVVGLVGLPMSAYHLFTLL